MSTALRGLSPFALLCWSPWGHSGGIWPLRSPWLCAQGGADGSTPPWPLKDFTPVGDDRGLQGGGRVAGQGDPNRPQSVLPRLCSEGWRELFLNMKVLSLGPQGVDAALASPRPFSVLSHPVHYAAWGSFPRSDAAAQAWPPARLTSAPGSARKAPPRHAHLCLSSSSWKGLKDQDSDFGSKASR